MVVGGSLEVCGGQVHRLVSSLFWMGFFWARFLVKNLGLEKSLYLLYFTAV
jgi:hypothetical protein